MKAGKLGIVIAVVLLIGTSSVALAAEGQAGAQGARALQGEIAAISGAMLTVQTPRGEAHVVTHEGTAFCIPGTADGTADDLAVGDTVLVLGRRTGATFRAALVAVIPPGLRIERVGGQVAMVEGNDIAVSVESGETAIIHTDADTAFLIPGVEDPGIGDIETGNIVLAAGSRSDDGGLQAILVVAPQGMGQRSRRLSGEVTAIEGATLTLHTRGERLIEVLTDEETAFFVAGLEAPSLSDLNVGDQVNVAATMAEGIPYARTVVVTPAGAARLVGQVTGSTGTTLTVETRHGAVQVLTDDGTLIRVPGVQDPTLADIAVGDEVTCGGTWADADSFQALVVAVPVGIPGPGRPGAIRGRAIAVASDRITVGTPHGPVVVVVDEETIIRIPGVEDPTLADIAAGDIVSARGVWNEAGNLEAAGVEARNGERAESLAPTRQPKMKAAQ
ncbi:MAG: hypothetical protein JW900_09360 [Anaerolineae bacterium]|nr:hypothetical protein [Anaerolineae bacterium]